MGKLIDPAQYERDQDQQVEGLEAELQEVRGDDVPEKYKGKSVEDLIEMHKNAEQRLGQLGNEVGSLRKQVLQPREERKPEPKKEVNVDLLLENPEEAVETLVKQSPSVRKLNETVAQFEVERSRSKFESKHGDWKDDMQNPAFFEFVNGHDLRKGLAAAADSGDFQAADYLWDMWKEVKQVKSQEDKAKKEQEKATRERKLKDGTLESGTGNSTESKKVFKRSEIRDLKMRAKQGDRKAQAVVDDPSWQTEILNAYAQKRVI
jgi:hypothetical protein